MYQFLVSKERPLKLSTHGSMIVTFKSYVQPRVKTRVFLASKTSLSIADHLQATFINRYTFQVYIETLKMPLTQKQPKKWRTNGQTDKQTDQPNTLPLLRMRAHGVITASLSDEDAVYLPESVVRGLHICKRVRSPTVCEGPSTYTWRQKQWPLCCMPSGVGLPRVCRAVGHPG